MLREGGFCPKTPLESTSGSYTKFLKYNFNSLAIKSLKFGENQIRKLPVTVIILIDVELMEQRRVNLYRIDLNSEQRKYAKK